MAEQGNFMIHLSVLYRNTQKYFDHALEPYGIGWGQLMFLFVIYENEGITMQEVTRISEVDKGTTTKSMQKLLDQGYVVSKADEKDKRVKRLYTTEKSGKIMNKLYEFRSAYRNSVFDGIDGDAFEKMMAKTCENSHNIVMPSFDDLKIGGLQKVTLLDYPGRLAATVFTAGCSFKCPFCHNRDLVFVPEDYSFVNPDEILTYLGRRKGILDGVCISGGEPLVQPDLLPFMEKIKNMGFLVKLDTNGYEPEKLKEAVQSGLVDYVAMDLKNCKEKYAMTCGMQKAVFQMDRIEESVSYLLAGHVDYEFRTTVVRELHDKEDLLAAASWIRGAKHYYLQQFHDSGTLIQEGYHGYDARQMEELCEAVRTMIPQAEFRGVKGETDVQSR